ncbi:MAG: hypothetical protein ABIC57_00970, partial [bacterium]
AYVGEHQYMQDTIEPRLRRLEEKINEKLMPMYDENLFIGYDEVIPSDKEFTLRERTSNLGSYVTTVNEEREEMGKDPVDWGDIPLASAGIAPLGSQAAAPGAPGGAGAETPPGESAPTEDELGVSALDAASSGGDLSGLSDEELSAGIAALGGKSFDEIERITKRLDLYDSDKREGDRRFADIMDDVTTSLMKSFNDRVKGVEERLLSTR